MELNVEYIEVGERMRPLDKDKVKSLADSFSLIGQQHPITIKRLDGRYILLAGRHRLEAAKLLGWTSIKASVFDGDDLECELVEIDENLMNNELTVLEQSEHIQRRNEILEAMGQRAKQGDNRFTADRGDTVSPLKTTEDIAKDVGLSRRSTQRRSQIARDISPDVKEAIRNTPIADSTTQLLDLARLDPEDQAEVAKQINEGAKSVKDARRKIAKEKQKNMPKPELPKGTYEVIYADPPWSYDNSGFTQSAASQYPTLSIEEICSLDVGALTNNRSVLFMWATSPLLPDAFRVIEAWGFEYKASMIWVKDRAPGMGWWVNTKHELLLIACKDINHPSIKFDSVIEAPVTRHSAKPNQFYGMIEAMYDGNKIELFARNKREGWDNWGNENV